jgi:hypothetical protein
MSSATPGRTSNADHVVTSVAEAVQLVFSHISTSGNAHVGSNLSEVQATP